MQTLEIFTYAANEPTFWVILHNLPEWLCLPIQEAIWSLNTGLDAACIPADIWEHEG